VGQSKLLAAAFHHLLLAAFDQGVAAADRSSKAARHERSLTGDIQGDADI
jgi:hypothetical protein